MACLHGNPFTCQVAPSTYDLSSPLPSPVVSNVSNGSCKVIRASTMSCNVQSMRQVAHFYELHAKFQIANRNAPVFTPHHQLLPPPWLSVPCIEFTSRVWKPTLVRRTTLTGILRPTMNVTVHTKQHKKTCHPSHHTESLQVAPDIQRTS